MYVITLCTVYQLANIRIKRHSVYFSSLASLTLLLQQFHLNFGTLCTVARLPSQSGLWYVTIISVVINILPQVCFLFFCFLYTCHTCTHSSPSVPVFKSQQHTYSSKLYSSLLPAWEAQNLLCLWPVSALALLELWFPCFLSFPDSEPNSFRSLILLSCRALCSTRVSVPPCKRCNVAGPCWHAPNSQNPRRIPVTSPLYLNKDCG